METTHVLDEEGNFIQIVTPARLVVILDAEGSDYSRPADFGPSDEWVLE